MLVGQELEVKREARCPECGSLLIVDHKRGETVCQNCGLVVDDIYIDYGPDWRVFSGEQRITRPRTGGPMTELYHDRGLSTIIGDDVRRLSNSIRAKIYKLKKIHRQTILSSPKEKNLALALRELDRLSSALGLPKPVREFAAVIYKRAVENNLLRGRSIECMVSATVYAACRHYNLPRTLTEIARCSVVRKDQIGRAYKILSKYLNLKLPMTPIEAYISRFCNELNLSEKVRNLALEILKMIQERNLTSGKSPAVVAAGIIYIAANLCNEKRTQKEIAQVAKVTEVSIRSRSREYREVLSNLDITIVVQ